MLAYSYNKELRRVFEGLVLKEYRERVRFLLLNDLSAPGGLVVVE